MSENKLGELAKALIAAKAEMGPLVAAQTAKIKTKSGGEYAYAFADLSDVYAACELALGKHGIAILQNVWTSTEARLATVETTMYHAESDQSFTGGHIEMPASGTPQDMGSAITYARRYSLVSTVGLATQDDDGSAATNAAKAQPPAQAPAPPRKPQATKTVAKLNPDAVRKSFHASGAGLFGKDWENARHLIIERYTTKETPDNIRTSASDMKPEELVVIADTFKTSATGWKSWLQETMAQKSEPISAHGDDYDHAAADTEHPYRYS